MFLFRSNKNDYYSSTTKLLIFWIIISIKSISTSNSNTLYNKLNILTSQNDSNHLKSFNNNNDFYNQKLTHVSFPFNKSSLDRNVKSYITASSDKYKTSFDLYDDLRDIAVSDLNIIFQEMEKTELKKTSPKSNKLTTASVEPRIGAGKMPRQNGSSSTYSSIGAQTRRLIGEISIFLSIAICLMGIITNFLSLKVFCSTKVPRTSSRTYLIALSVTDLIFLVVHFIDDTCKQIVEQFKLDVPLNLTDQKVSMCRAFALIRSTCRSASPWIIVVFTLERFLVVNYPQHTNVISKPLIAKRLLYIIIIFSVLISLYAPILSSVYYVQSPQSNQMRKTTKKIQTTLYSANYNTNINENIVRPTPVHHNSLNNYYGQTSLNSHHHLSYHFLNQHHRNLRKTCDILSDYRSIYLYFTLFYTILIIVVPLIIVSVFNTLLIRSLYKSTDQWTTAKLEMHEQEMSYKEIKDKQIQIENLKITWTLIIISLTFILLTLPHMIVYFIISNKLIKSSSIHVIHKITELFYLLNHSVNFFLYVISRKSFRKVLKDKLRCDCFNIKHHAFRHHSENKSYINFSPNSVLQNENNNNSILISENQIFSNSVDSNKIQPLLNENEFEISTVSKLDNISELRDSNGPQQNKQGVNNKNHVSKKNDIDYEKYWNLPEDDDSTKNKRASVTFKSPNQPSKSSIKKSPNNSNSKKSGLEIIKLNNFINFKKTNK